MRPGAMPLPMMTSFWVMRGFDEAVALVEEFQHGSRGI
jgi:hypothetical protein